jgi:hypothetical protein
MISTSRSLEHAGTPNHTGVHRLSWKDEFLSLIGLTRARQPEVTGRHSATGLSTSQQNLLAAMSANSARPSTFMDNRAQHLLPVAEQPETSGDRQDTVREEDVQARRTFVGRASVAEVIQRPAGTPSNGASRLQAIGDEMLQAAIDGVVADEVNDTEFAKIYAYLIDQQ